jgi:phosphatidylglycerophosphate synthase
VSSVRGGGLLVVGVEVAVLAGLLGTSTIGAVAAAAGAAYLALADVLVVRGLAGARSLGIANAVTWLRCALAGGVVALVVDGIAGPLPVPVFLVLASVALLMDAVDGRIARRTHTVTAFGARFDMEVDASLVLALSVAAAGVVGPWVLLLGAARYLLLLAEPVLPWLGAPTPVRRWRKAVAAAQGIVLTVVAAGLLPLPVSAVLSGAAAAALAYSFGTQVWWLARHARRPVLAAIPGGARVSGG